MPALLDGGILSCRYEYSAHRCLNLLRQAASLDKTLYPPAYRSGPCLVTAPLSTFPELPQNNFLIERLRVQ